MEETTQNPLDEMTEDELREFLKDSGMPQDKIEATIAKHKLDQQLTAWREKVGDTTNVKHDTNAAPAEFVV